MKLREYQQKSIDELFDWFSNGGIGNPLMVLPTGAGKSVIIAKLMQIIIDKWPGQRICICTHSKELIEQNHEKLVSIWPLAPAGIYSAGLGRKDSHAQILYAGIQSIANKALHVGWFDLLFVDECHLIPKKGQGRYLKLIEDVKRINPNVRIIGLTATPFRLDSGYLYEGKDAIFSDIATEVSVLELLELGYLSPLVSRPTHIDLDTSNIKKRGGEFITGDIERAIHDQNHISRALENAIPAAEGRKRWLVFCPSVETAHEASDYLEDAGFTSAVVSGKTEKNERARLIEAYKTGEIKALCNCEVLTTGFDAPETDVIVMLRPTESTALYIQMLGRGMRIAEGKENCLVLDYAGNIERHGCVDDPNIKIPREKREPGEAPVKICSNCEAYCHAAAAECPECGELFPAPKPDIDQEHSKKALLSNQNLPELEDVIDWEFAPHNKPGKPTSLKVTYLAPGILPRAIVSEWVCFEHEGFARQKAHQWWLGHSGKAPAPSGILEAIDRIEELELPSQIEVIKEGKYYRITRRYFEDQEAA